MLYNNFLSTLVLGDILADNAFIIIAAIGATFVILSGGIDLSIGSMIGFVGVVMANLDAAGWHPLASAALMLVFGAGFGAVQGFIIEFCEIQPFIITLAGLFLLRGACFMVNLDSVPLRHPFVTGLRRRRPSAAGRRFSGEFGDRDVGRAHRGIVIAHGTSFGADVYAIGGDRHSAALMGVPMRRTMMKIYGLGGLYSALGGVVYALYTSSGYPLAGTGDELSAIAAVVLGGTLLTGGVGFVAGALFGGMILGPHRDADQFQRLAQRRLDHDQQRIAFVRFHCIAALARGIPQADAPSTSVRPNRNASSPETCVLERGPENPARRRRARRGAGAQHLRFRRGDARPRDRQRRLPAGLAAAERCRTLRSVLAFRARLCARPTAC